LIDQARPRIVALDLSGVPDFEYSAIKMLVEAEQKYRENGTCLWLVGLNPQVLDMIQRSRLGRVLGRDTMHFTLEVAVAKYLGTAANPGMSSLHDVSKDDLDEPHDEFFQREDR
jgi:MFS superfamily sulfate permease-like transporter